MLIRRIAASLIAAALATPLGLATPGAAAPPGPDAAADVTMSWSTTGSGGIDLDKADLGEVFTKANRKATYGSDCKVSGLKANPQVRWCLQSDDNASANWWPQGVTSDSDASDSEDWEGHHGLMVSWYHKGDKGARITLLDTQTKKYRHLLLVVPDGEGSYAPLSLHAGGIVWYGDQLYVADSYEGVRVFDLNTIWDLTEDPNGDVTDSDKIGKVGDTYYGHGYRYMVPQSGRWQSPEVADKRCSTSGPIHNSWMSLDRAASPHRLVIGEFCSRTEDSTPGRVTAWDMDGLKIDADADGVATADNVARLPAVNGAAHGANAQGGATTGGGDWFFSVSRGSNAAGDLYRHQWTADGWQQQGRKSTPQGNEDLSFRYRDSKRLMYSVSEYPDHRIIFARNTYSGW